MTLVESLQSQASVNDPFLGQSSARDFQVRSPLWPGDRWSAVQRTFVTESGSRRLEEYRFVPSDGSRPWLPVSFMFEAAPDGTSHVRVYSDHHLVEDRKPILEPIEDIHPWRSEEDVLFSYFQALSGNRLEGVLDLFQEDGYFRHSNGEIFTGRDKLRTDFSKMMGNIGIRIKYCRLTDDGTTCAVECYMPSGRPAVAVYQRGRPGKLRAVRIYL